MKNIKLSHVLFSLALIAALGLAMVPAAPVHALSVSAASTNPTLAVGQAQAPALLAPNALVCRTVIVWRHGHRIAIRRCHRVSHQPV